MKREHETSVELVEVGEASALTQGPIGAPVDERQGFLGAGLTED